MTPMDKQTFFVLLDVAGQLPSRIDENLGKAEAEFDAGRVVTGVAYTRAAHAVTAQLGIALSKLEAWGKNNLQGETMNAQNTPEFSPEGYTYVYAVDGNGQKLPNPRVFYDGQTFANGADVAAYKVAVAKSMADRLREQADVEAQLTLLKPNQLDIRSLNADDLRYFNRFSLELQNAVGPLKDVHDFFNWWAYGSSPLASIPATQALLSTRAAPFDFSKYEGPLKAYMPK